MCFPINFKENQNLINVPDKKYLYFYDQLNDWSKMIYTALYENKDNMKSGTYRIEINETISEN